MQHESSPRRTADTPAPSPYESSGAPGTAEEQQRASGTGDLGAFAGAYDASFGKLKRDLRTKLDRDFEKLRKLGEGPASALLDALAKAGGPTPDALQTEMRHITQIADPAVMQQRMRELQDRYAPLMRQAIAESRLDVEALRRKTFAAVDVPASVREPGKSAARATATALMGEETATGDSIGALWWSEPEPEPLPAPSAFTDVARRAPYPLFWSEGQQASVDPSRGSLSARSEMVIVLWAQSLAAAGAAVDVPPEVRRVRVEATVSVPSYYVGVLAFWTAVGYAAVHLHLQVMDGSRVVATQRFTVAETLAFLLWFAEKKGSGRYPLSCEFDHAFGTPRTYAGMVVLESWAACGVTVNWAKAQAAATVDQVMFRLMA